MRVRASSIVLLLAMTTLAITALGCHGTANSPTTSPATKQYPIRGTVISTDPANGEVLLKHDDVPGLMPAMTMAYRLEDPSALSELHPGDIITATLLADHDAAGPKNLRLREIVIVAQGPPRLQARRQLPRPRQRRCRSKLHPAQSVRAQDRSPAISRSSRPHDVHLHPLPALGLLPPHEPQLRHHRQDPEVRPRALQGYSSSQRQLRSQPTTLPKFCAATAQLTPATT